MLHRLPNGAWIRLNDVAEVIPYPARGDAGYHFVGIRNSDTWIEISFDTFAAAQAYADELAALVNEAKSGE